jgi:hypothetical protein
MIELALAAQLIVWLAIAAAFLASRQASLLHPATIYLGFHGLVFVLRPLLVHYFGFDANWKYMLFQPTESNFVAALEVSSLGLVCFVGASLWCGWSRFPSGSLPPQFTPGEQRALLLTTLLLLPLAAYSIYFTRNGIAGERIGGIYVMTNSTGYVNEAQHFVMTLLCAWLVVTKFHWGNLLPAALYVGYRAWFGWSRWTILLFLLMAVLAFCWYHRRKWLPAWSLAAAVPILIVFNLLGHNRDLLKATFSGQGIEIVEQRPGTPQNEKVKRQLDTQDFSNFDYLSYVVSVVPDRTGRYTYGLQYLQLLTEPIPRILWKEKPVGAPVKTIDIGAYANFIGLTVSLCGDGWMSGGWIGVAIMLSLAGIILGRAYRWCNEYPDSRLGGMAYVVALAMAPQWFRDGGISIFKFLLFTSIPILVWMGLAWFIGPRRIAAYSFSFPGTAKIRFVAKEDSPFPRRIPAPPK